MRRTQTYRAGRGSRTPRPVRVQLLDAGTTTDHDRNTRAACGCLILAAVTVVGSVCGGALFLAYLLLDW